MHPGGRPSTYTPDIADTICALIAQKWSVHQLTKRDDMPSEDTVYTWLLKHPEFAEKYAKAREYQAARYAEEIVEISDDSTNDWVQRETENGGTVTVVDHEHIQRSRLRVDSRKWVASKLLPKKYGDRQQVELSGEIGVRQMSDSVLDDRIVQGLVASGMSEEAARAYVARDKEEGP